MAEIRRCCLSASAAFDSPEGDSDAVLPVGQVGTAPAVVSEFLAADPDCDALFAQWEHRRVDQQGDGEHIVQDALALVLSAASRDVDLVRVRRASHSFSDPTPRCLPLPPRPAPPRVGTHRRRIPSI